MRIAAAFLVCVSLLPLAGCQDGFQEADVEQCKKSIREEYAKSGRFTVRDVVLLKESATKLSGFVKLHNDLIGDLTQSCTATMGENRRYIWRCGN